MKTVYARTQDYHLLNGHLITLPCWLNSVVSLASVGRPPCLLVMATIFTTVCLRHPFPLKVELSLLNTLEERQDTFGHTDLHRLNPFRLSQKWGDSNRGCVFLISYPIRFDTEEQLWSGPHDNKHPGSFSGPLFLSTHAFHRELDLLWGLSPELLLNVLKPVLQHTAHTTPKWEMRRKYSSLYWSLVQVRSQAQMYILLGSQALGLPHWAELKCITGCWPA